MIKEQQSHRQQPIQQEYSFDKVLLPALIKANANSQYCVNLRKQYDSMLGSPQQKCKVLTKRLQKFFGRDKQAKINLKVGYFCARRDPNYSLQKVYPLQNEIVLFGTDFMKKKQIMDLYNPEQCTSIDLSHWKLVYDDYFSAFDALNKNQRQNVIQNKIKLQLGNVQIPKKWIEMKPYYTYSYERRVLARFATSEQKQISTLPKAEPWIFQSAKKVYQTKKRQSQNIIQNCRIRDQRIRQERMQKRSNRVYNHQNQRNYSNFDKQEKIYLKDKERQRSRQRQSQYDDKKSIKSKTSKKSNFSELVKGLGNIGLNDSDNQDQFNVSFILNQNHELSRQMQQKLGQGQFLFDIQNQQSIIINMNQISYANNDSANVNSSQNNINNSYSLSENMPGPQRQIDRSFEVKQFNYREYLKQQQLQQQRRRKQQRQIINLIDSDDD